MEKWKWDAIIVEEQFSPTGKKTNKQEKDRTIHTIHKKLKQNKINKG